LHLPDALNKLENLSTLDISYNNFSEVPAVLQRAFDREGEITEKESTKISEQQRREIVKLTINERHTRYARRKTFHSQLRRATPQAINMSEHSLDEQFLTKKQSCRYRGLLK
jgi:Leucine-rich repeat (LRR) protein